MIISLAGPPLPPPAAQGEYSLPSPVACFSATGEGRGVGACYGFPLQILTVLSVPAEATVLPSGEKATALALPTWPE